MLRESTMIFVALTVDKFSPHTHGHARFPVCNQASVDRVLQSCYLLKTLNYVSSASEYALLHEVLDVTSAYQQPQPFLGGYVARTIVHCLLSHTGLPVIKNQASHVQDCSNAKIESKRMSLPTLGLVGRIKLKSTRIVSIAHKQAMKAQKYHDRAQPGRSGKS